MAPASLMALFDILWSIQIPVPVTLGVIAVVGYLVGRRRKIVIASDEAAARREMKRAHAVARELEKIAAVLRRDLANHHASVARFKEHLTSVGGSPQEIAWQDLCREAEEILQPTIRLASQISHAYDSIRQQTSHLMTFTEVRTDPLTGVSNRRALDDSLDTLFAMRARYQVDFSLAIVDIDHFKQINDRHGHLHGDQALRDVARVIDECLRETDLVARFGGEEFVILLPSTPLAGACTFAERLRKRVAAEFEPLGLTISVGVAIARNGDDAESLLSRADAALYGAKSAGRNRAYRHCGQRIDAIESPDAAPTETPAAAG